MLDSKLELIELCKTNDGESESEAKHNEKYDKLFADMYDQRSDILQNALDILDSSYLMSQHHSDVATPPPESVLIIS